MTIDIRIWRFSFAFEFALMQRREPEPERPTITPAVGFVMPGPDYLPDEIQQPLLGAS